MHWKWILPHNYGLFQDQQTTSDGEWKPFMCCSAGPGFVGRCLCDHCVNVAQVDEGETCYEFLWLVHPLISCLNTLTYSAAVFTIKHSSGSICFWEFIYWSACLTADMELTFLEWRITMKASEVLVGTWILFHGKRWRNKKHKPACCWTVGQYMQSVYQRFTEMNSETR